jgi:thiamine-phosphate pyrophosphorylase
VKLASAAQSLNRRARKRAAGLPALFFLTDEKRTPDPLAIARRLPRGTGIILRHYDDANRAALALALARIARARGLVLFIAADPILALAVGAAGVHWPEGLLPQTRRYPGSRRLLITAAAHSPRAIICIRNKADAVLLSPVFPTKSGAAKCPLGALRFAQWVRGAPLPVYALGGITARNVQRLAASGAAGLAAIGAFDSEN